MFKLVSLSSPSGLFNKIIFRDGLNIILGEYAQAGKDINGIGKTTIVSLIDYCLLADGPKKLFFSDKYNFLEEESVCLTIIIDSVRYRIERRFNSISRAKALFGKDGSDLTEYADVDLRMILGELIMKHDEYPGVYDPSWFRTIMSFYVQDDHSFLARDSNNIEKFLAGSQRKAQLLTYNMFLLGIDNTKIWSFDGSRVELKELQSDQTRIRKQVKEQTGKNIDSMRAEVESIERKVRQFEESLNSYKFEPSYVGLEETISELSRDISQLNSEYMNVNRKLVEIKESLEVNIDIDVEKIKKTYFELHQQFSEYICKELKDVIKFRSDISANRSIFLRTREKKYSERLSELKQGIIDLEKDRSGLYKRLEEQSAFDAIKSTYANLIEEQSSLDSRRVYLSQIDAIEIEIARKRTETSSIVTDIVRSKQELTREINEIKNLFIEIVENSVDTVDSDVKPYLSFEPRSNISSPIHVNIEVPRSGSLGKGRFKILAYDLTVFINACTHGRALPNFLIHDGVFHGIAHKTRIKLLNYLDVKLNSIGNIQYIITLNEDEIIFPDDVQEEITELDFNLKDKVIAGLKDSPEEMFFGHEFG